MAPGSQGAKGLSGGYGRSPGEPRATPRPEVYRPEHGALSEGELGPRLQQRRLSSG